MKVLGTTTEEQTIRFISREDVANVVLVLTNKDTKVSESYNISPLVLEGYMVIVNSYSLTEGSRYSLTVLDAGDTSKIIYRDMVLCTDQDNYEKYDIQEGDYVFNQTPDNDYVII